jgi:hypothetical protein
MNVFNATSGSRRVEQLDAYFRDNVMGCRHLASCRLSWYRCQAEKRSRSSV